MDKRREPSFSLYEFRSWLSKQKGVEKAKQRKKKRSDPGEGVAGTKVESRLGIQRLEEKIAAHNPSADARLLSENFKSCGGVIVEVNDMIAVIQTEGGQFMLPKLYTKPK